MAKHGYAAFAPEDVADAKRGAPDVDLAAYAAARGLTFRGSTILSAFRGVLPAWADYTFNAMSGVLPGGGYGLLEHELEQIATTAGSGIAMNGAFHGARFTARGPSWKGLLLPFLDTERKVPNEPFAPSAIWVPTTKVVVRVPEAALLRRMVVRRADRFPPAGNPKLEAEGLPGFRLAGGGDVDPQLRAAIFGGPAGRVLAGLTHAYVSLVICDGVVALQRNGFARGDAELDALAQAACAIADGVCEACRPLHRPQPFSAHLAPPPPARLRPDPDDPFPRPLPDLADAFARAASELAMTQEDPAAYHRAYPSLPVPGVAQGVLRGRIPGASVDGRLAWHVQSGFARGSLRGAVLVPARAGAATQPGGVLHEETDLYAEVADGIAACWVRVRTTDRLDARPLAERAVATLRRLGLADVDGAAG